MRVAGWWTQLMAMALAGYACLIGGTVLGGGWIAWILAVPVMFCGLQILGLPIVLLCELAEKGRVLPRCWRPLVDEVVIVMCLVGLGFLVLPGSVTVCAACFFVGMYAVRLIARSSWRPGEAEEVEG